MNRMQRSLVTAGARAAFAIAVIVSFLPGAARGEYRHALVIGQSKYKAGELSASSRDAAAVAEALERRGFTVTRAENLATVKELDDVVKAFARKVPTGGTALLYHSEKVAPVPIPPGAKSPRNEAALVTLDGAQHSLAAVLRPVVVAQFGPYKP